MHDSVVFNLAEPSNRNNMFLPDSNTAIYGESEQ